MVSIAVVNQKGGVGKTTVALGLASAAHAAGLRVLVVDLDPQANASTGLGVWESATTVDHALEVDRPGGLADVLTAAGWPTPEGQTIPDVAASSPQLAQREPQLANDPIGAQDRLQVAMEGLDHDLIVIDCPPSLGLLTVNGLFAADQALVVTEPGAWASDGVAQILRTVTRISARRPGGLGVAGIVVNRLGRTRDARYWYEQLVETYGDQVLPPVRMRAAIPEAAAQSLPIHGMGARPGAAEAAGEFEDLLAVVLGETESSASDPEVPPVEPVERSSRSSISTRPMTHRAPIAGRLLLPSSTTWTSTSSLGLLRSGRRLPPVAWRRSALPSRATSPAPATRTEWSMAQYDPQRSHSRHRATDDDGPAPVDALLGPDPDEGHGGSGSAEVSDATSRPGREQPPAEGPAPAEPDAAGKAPAKKAAAKKAAKNAPAKRATKKAAKKPAKKAPAKKAAAKKAPAKMATANEPPADEVSDRATPPAPAEASPRPTPAVEPDRPEPELARRLTEPDPGEARRSPLVALVALAAAAAVGLVWAWAWRRRHRRRDAGED